jgi:hypothetical protein
MQFDQIGMILARTKLMSHNKLKEQSGVDETRTRDLLRDRQAF